MNFKKIVFVSLIFTFLLSCGNKEKIITDFTKIGDLTISPKEGTYSLKLSINGQPKCPLDLYILMDNEQFRKYHFEDNIDTVITNDWYENKLSFQVSPKECVSDIETKIELYY